MLATGIFVSMYCTFPVVASPICPSLSTNTAYTILFVVTVIPVLAFAHPNAVCLLAFVGSLSVIFNVYDDVIFFNVAVTFTLPFVQPLGLYVNVTFACVNPVTVSVVLLTALLTFPALSFTNK